MDQHFQELLLEYAHANNEARLKEIENKLWNRFGVTRTVLVFDMSGFSSLSRRYGIVHFLSMVRRMQITTQEIISRLGGEVVKFEADNCFALFYNVDEAVQASIELNQTFNKLNEQTTDECDIRIAIGIDYGPILLIGGPDYFGDPVNTACKLGEDTAAAGEILLTKRAYEQLAIEHRPKGEILKLSISGIEITAYKIHYLPTTS